MNTGVLVLAQDSGNKLDESERKNKCTDSRMMPRDLGHAALLVPPGFLFSLSLPIPRLCPFQLLFFFFFLFTKYLRADMTFI